MLVKILLIIPIITALFCIVLPARWIGRFQSAGMLFLFSSSILLLRQLLKEGSMYAFENLFYIDALSMLMILLITTVSMLSSVYSIGYMTNETEEKIQDSWKLKTFYLLLNSFIFAMLLLVITNSLGVLWISIELTTLISAFLVGYYNRETPVEAAWKYIILCTVGIAFAMIGIVILYYAVTHVGGVKELGLDWNYLVTIAHKLNPGLMKVAFIFILIGFGTKAGLAPMHTWLPDAHSEAPTPVSALLSGVLLKCALYGIIRFAILTKLAVGAIFISKLLFFFGIFSLIIAAPFILVQRNIKRLLAYSSLEHIGLITIGLAFGTPLAVFGALIHMINHAMTKSLLFFTAGNISLKFHTKDIEHIKGAINVMPFSSIALLIGALAICGSPPFSIFLSEFYIITGGIKGNHWLGCIVMILLLVVIFGGISYQILQMLLGSESDSRLKPITKGEVNRSGVAVLVLPLILICILGWWIPAPLYKLLNEAVNVVSGGSI